MKGIGLLLRGIGVCCVPLLVGVGADDFPRMNATVAGYALSALLWMAYPRWIMRHPDFNQETWSGVAGALVPLACALAYAVATVVLWMDATLRWPGSPSETVGLFGVLLALSLSSALPFRRWRGARVERAARRPRHAQLRDAVAYAALTDELAATSDESIDSATLSEIASATNLDLTRLQEGMNAAVEPMPMRSHPTPPRSLRPDPSSRGS